MQDGSIAESVVWQCSPSEQHHIVDHVMLHALQRHLGSDCAVTGHASLLDAAMLQRDSHLDEQATARRSEHHAHVIVLAKVSHTNMAGSLGQLNCVQQQIWAEGVRLQNCQHRC